MDKDMTEEFYSRFIAPGDLVFDIGANVGLYTQVFSRMARKVVAVEPQAGLLDKFKAYPNVAVVEKACGSHEGELEMLISSTPAISSLSPEWVRAVRDSRRFDGHEWNERCTVKATTLDALILEHGIPSFIKIDVEGYEVRVLEGLTQKIRALSFEFTPEYEVATARCLEILHALGDYEFNYGMQTDIWTDTESLLGGLAQFRGNNVAVGDIYARLRTGGRP